MCVVIVVVWRGVLAPTPALTTTSLIALTFRGRIPILVVNRLKLNVHTAHLLVSALIVIIGIRFVRGAVCLRFIVASFTTSAIGCSIAQSIALSPRVALSRFRTSGFVAILFILGLVLALRW